MKSRHQYYPGEIMGPDWSYDHPLEVLAHPRIIDSTRLSYARKACNARFPSPGKRLRHFTSKEKRSSGVWFASRRPDGWTPSHMTERPQFSGRSGGGRWGDYLHIGNLRLLVCRLIGSWKLENAYIRDLSRFSAGKDFQVFKARRNVLLYTLECTP